MTPRFLDNDTYLLTNERGVTLLEVLVSALVLAVLVISIYIGIQYAEKQSVLNNRQRAATLLATGEYNKYNANQNDLEFMPYGNQEVTIDVLESGAQLTGLQSVSTRRASEFSGAQQYPYTEVITRVEWIDPASGETQYIEMREDYYVRAGN